MRRYSWICCSHNTSQRIIFSSKRINSDSGKDSIVKVQVNRTYRWANKQNKRKRQRRVYSQASERNCLALRKILIIMPAITLILRMMNRLPTKRNNRIRLYTLRIIVLCRLICFRWLAWLRIKYVKTICLQRSMKKRSISGNSSGNKVRHSDISRAYFKSIVEDGLHYSLAMSHRRMNLLWRSHS